MSHFVYPMMATRRLSLQETMLGYELTGEPLIAVHHGRFVSASLGDDQGIYWLIPALARTLHLGLDETLTGFFLATLLVSFALGIQGFFFLLRNPLSRVFAIAGLGSLCLAAWRSGDVYLFPVAATVAIVPLFLYYWRKRISVRRMTFFLLICGLALGVAQIIRGQSATGTFLFILCVAAFSGAYSRKQKLVFAGVLFLGGMVPSVCLHNALARRDVFLEAHDDGCEIESVSHPFWHSVYAGLAFVRNPDVPAYYDGAAFARATSIDPNVVFYSSEYEHILRHEVLLFARRHSAMFLEILAGKAGMTLLWLLLCANVGLIAAFFYTKGRVVEYAFWLALGFNSLFGILVMPVRPYVLGFCGFAVLYGILGTGVAIDSGAIPRLRNWLRGGNCSAQNA